MDGLAIEPDRACTAIPGVTSFLHSKPAKAPQECSQALAGPRFGREALAIDLIVHAVPACGSGWESSRRICSAK